MNLLNTSERGIGASGIGASLIALVVGSLLTTITQKLLAKTAKFRYSTNVQKVATSADDPIFGSIRVTWGNNSVRNLYIAEVEIENLSSRDFESVDFKVYCEYGTFLLNERSSVEGTPYIVPWSEGFKASLAVEQGAAPTQTQQNAYYHSRDYNLKVFNRGQLLRLNYLCTRPNDDLQPEVFVSTQLKGVRLIRQAKPRLFFGVPTHIALVRGLVISVLVVLSCGLLLHSVWIAAIVSLAAGLFVLPIGCAEYVAERWAWKLIAG